MNLKTLATYIGRAIVLLSFGFLFYVLKGLDFSLILPLFKATWLLYILALSLLFALLYLFNASAWRDILELIIDKKVSKEAIAVYLKTVIFKYLPGNVFHFLGRHSLSGSEGLDHKKILLSNTFEILFLLFNVLGLLLFGTMFFDFKIDLWGYFVLKRELILALFLLIFSLAIFFAYIKGYLRYLKKHSFKVLKIVAKNSIFLLGSALILVAVFALMLGVDFSLKTVFETVFVALIAWLLGFVIPGAPGGIGIRESIFVMLLPPILAISKEMVLVGALLYRIITILGEGVTYFISTLFKKEPR